MNDITNFISGFDRFHSKYFGAKPVYADLRGGQHPKALVVACCDSRSDPAQVTDADPGDLFVIRNIANLVPPLSYHDHAQAVCSGLEFGVRVLEVERIIVMGHCMCGGIRTLMEGSHPELSHVHRWISIAEPARDKVRHDLGDKSLEMQCRACELAAILVSLDNLMTYPWVRERVEAGRLALDGWYFDLAAGELMGYDAASRRYRCLVSNHVQG